MRIGEHHPEALEKYFKALAFVSEFRRASYQEIMNHIGWKSSASVVLCMEYLESQGYISIERPNGKGYPNIYRPKVTALYGVVERHPR